MGSFLETRRLQRIIVPSIPLLKQHLGVLVIGIIPLQHGRAKLDTRALAVGLDDTLRVIEDIVSIYDSDVALGHDALLIEII